MRYLSSITFVLFFTLLLINQASFQKGNRGFLRIDGNNRYFVFDNGMSYVPVGFNKFQLYKENEKTIDSLLSLWSSYGVNYLRVWLGGGSEPEFPVGTFDESRMKKIDYIISKCEENGIYLSLCFWDENTLRTDVSYGWNNKRMAYNKAIDSSGTTYDPEDLKGIEHLPSWNAIKNRYAIFVRRWTRHTGIMMWDLVNDCKKTEVWKDRMYDYIRSIDPNNHNITLQKNTGKDPGGDMDCGSVRVYEYNPGGNDPELMAEALFERILEAIQHGDPVICGEGRMNCAEASPYELERFFLHSLWGPTAAGAAGNLHAWVCETKEGRWPDLTLQELKWMKNYSDFCNSIDWSHFNSRNLNDKLTSKNQNIKVYVCGDDSQVFLYLLNDDPAKKFSAVKTTLDMNFEFKNLPVTMDWIDIRSGKVIRSRKIESFPAVISAPAFRDGLFAHLSK